MRFTIYYRGPLKANGSPKDKQRIRRSLHPQFRKLWERVPLSDFRAHFLDEEQGRTDEPGLSILRELGGFTFAPLVTEGLALVAELNILLLRPSGRNVLDVGGDLDNRLKTLLDALSVPQTDGLPVGDEPTEDEQPLFCLLEDDALVTKLTVEADYLLDEQKSSNEVVAIIRVETRQLRVMMSTIGLA